ncbi:MAG: RNA polymerase sigma-70 factor [Dysgonamonadaceae bacterium]|nr:RNA polymerase sigma-70 factor [Dysgonamonadaceae bacterium]
MEQQNNTIDIEQLALRNQDVFRQLFMQYFPKVKCFIVFFVKKETVAEELSQDVFENIWKNCEFLRNVQSLSAYIFRMAKNIAINYLNHKTVEENYLSSYIPEEEYSIEDDIYAKELALLIRLTVERMPTQRRRIFEMSRIQNMKNADIAEKLQISKKTVENHLNLALKQIREITLLIGLFFIAQ